MDVLITGDSHTAALRRGQLALEADGLWPAGIDATIAPLGGGHIATEPFFVDRGDHAELSSPEYRRRFKRLPRPEDGPGTVYGLSAPLHSARLWRHPAWQSFVPAGAGPGRAGSGGATPVSSGMVRRLAVGDQRHGLGLLALLKRLGHRVFAIEPPPPFRHHRALNRTAAEVAIRINRLYRDAILAELARLDVPVVAVPAACLDNGFTRPEYGTDGDPHHGNARYGRVMMDAILDHLRRPARAAA